MMTREIIEASFFDLNALPDLPPPLPRETPKKRFSPPNWMNCKAMTARYQGTCAETGADIRQNEWMLYDSANRQAFALKSETFGTYLQFFTELRSYQ